MSLLIHGGGVFMKLDAEGRLMVTDFIRDFTASLPRSPSWVGRIIFSFGSRCIPGHAAAAREGAG